MSISISNNLNTQSYNPTTKKNTAGIGRFTMPHTDEQTTVEVSDVFSKEKLREEDFRFIYNDLTSRTRVLPPEIMNGNRLEEFIEANVAKIVFEFGEDGSIRIKEGLSPTDYARAKVTLRDIEFWRNGGMLPK